MEYEWGAVVEPLLAWYNREARVLPWRENTQGYRVWLSEIMLQQTRVETVIPYYLRFLERFPTVKELAQAPEEELMKFWEGLGYYSRAKNLKKAAELICESYDEVFPRDYEEIRKLPGVGDYTAGAIASIAFGQPKAAVDGNVLRVAARLTKDKREAANPAFRKEIAEELEQVYPAGRCGEFTQSLMELGAVICVPNGRAKCDQCPLLFLCRAGLDGSWQEYPCRKKKARRRLEEKTVFLLRNGGLIALLRRQEKGLLAGMWEFPNVDGHLSVREVQAWAAGIGFKKEELLRIEAKAGKKHIFSHVEWDMKCYEIETKRACGAFSWVRQEELDKVYALATAFRKLM